MFEVISFFEDLIQIIPEIKTEIGTVLEAQILRNVEVAAQTPNGIIANEVLAQMQTDGGTESYTVNGKKFIGIYVSAVYEVVGKEYANQTGRILSALGLRTDRPRITKTRSGPNGEEEENTKRYTMVRIPDEKKIKELKSRYDPEFVSAILSSIEWGSHAILDGWDERDRQKGEGYLETTPKNDNESRELKDGETKNNKNTTPPSQFVRPVRPVSPEVIEEVDNTNVQNEKTLFDDSLWERDTKKALFKFIQSENRSLKPKAIHDMNPDHKIDLPKIYELCEELTHEGSFTKNKDHSYSINPNNVVKAVSEEECQQLINSLKEEGIPVRVNDSGKSYDDRSFKIAVEKSYYSKHKEAVNAKMAEHGFTRSNRGEFDSIFFIQPLKGADSQ